MEGRKQQSIPGSNPSRCGSTFWRTAAYYTGLTAPYSGIPHLRGNWNTGKLTDLQNGLTQTMVQAAQHGKMCTFWSEGNLMILVSDPEQVYQYKVNCLHKYTDAHIDNWDALLGDSATNNKHLSTRKIWHDFLRDNLATVQATVAAVTDQHIARLIQNDEFVINDAGTYFHLFALELAMRIFMGMESIDLEDQKALTEFLAELFTDIPDIGLILLNLKSLDTSPSSIQKIQAFANKVQTKFDKLILEPNKLSTDSVFYKLWQATRDFRSEQTLTDTNLLAEAFFFLTGGPVMTTGDSFPILIKLICSNPEVKEKLVSLLSNDENAAQDYLDQIIKEAYRLQPPVGVLPAREIMQPFMLDGITLNQGDYIFVAPFVNHLDPKVWKNPEKFDPERFSSENEKSIPRGAYLPFGLGQRECPGRKYGLNVLKIALTKFFRDFDVIIEKDAELKQIGPTKITVDKMNIKFIRRETHEMQLSAGVRL